MHHHVFAGPRRLVTLTLVAALLAGCGGGSSAGSSVPVAATATGTVTKAAATSKIQHIIVVILENRSFDNLFHFLDHSRADVGDFGFDHLGNKVMLKPESFTETSDYSHDYTDFVTEFNGGANNGWDLNSQKTGDPLYQYSYLPQSEVQPYLDITSEFATSDRFFHGITAPTFPSHVEIGASTTFGVFGNPSVGIPWGCDAAAGTTTVSLDPTGKPIPGPFPCFTGQSIYDLLDRKGVTWRYYSEPEGKSISGNLVIPAAFRSTRFGSDWNKNIAADDKEINAALTSGTGLPQVSYVIPDSSSTDHPGFTSLGPTYVANLVNNLGASSYYNNTLMIVTWDDWGGCFDHVVPKKRPDGSQLSYRKPVLLVGGYVKHNYISHVETEDASINKTIEEVFNLGSLGAHDVFAAPFDDALDFTQTPPAFKPINPAFVYSPTTPGASIVPVPITKLGKLGPFKS